MSDGAKDLLAKSLEAVGAHQRGATAAAAHSGHVRDAVAALFARGLRHVYAAHHQGAAQAAENRDLASRPELKAALAKGVDENRTQAERLERVFRLAGHAVEGTPDQAMQGIIDDNKAANAEADDPVARDQQLIASGQLAAHYYLARYGTLRSYAQTLGLSDAAGLLQETIDETVRVDEGFTVLAHHLLVASA